MRPSTMRRIVRAYGLLCDTTRRQWRQSPLATVGRSVAAHTHTMQIIHKLTVYACLDNITKQEKHASTHNLKPHHFTLQPRARERDANRIVRALFIRRTFIRLGSFGYALAMPPRRRFE